MASTSQVQVLYIAYFGRPADPDGLAFWTNGVVGTNEELDQLADSFADSPEYLATIQGLRTEQIVDLFYQNLFSRFADQEGQDFWVDGITSGVLNPQDIGVDIGLAALNQDRPNSDTVGIAAKVDAANKFTKALEVDPRDDKAYSRSPGIKAGRIYLLPVTDAATIPSDADVANSINSIFRCGGGGFPGDIVNGVLNLSVHKDVVSNINTQLFQIINGAQGPFIRSILFALTDGNQAVAAVASDNNLTNTLNALDSLVDASGTDSDTLTITASGGSDLQSATVTNIENIVFDLDGYTASTLISAAAGINATGVNNIQIIGSLAAGNTVIVDGTGSGASIINASGTIAAGATASFRLIANAADTNLTGANGDDFLIGADGEDSLVGNNGNDTYTGGGNGDLFVVEAGADLITDFGVGGPDSIIIASGSATVNVTEDYTAGSVGSIDNQQANTAAVFNVANDIDFNSAAATGTTNGITITADTGNAASALTGTNKADIITGNAGANIITGGVGSDEMNGGAGADDFVQTGQVDAAGAVQADTISGFTINSEQIGNWSVGNLNSALVAAGAAGDILVDLVGVNAAVADVAVVVDTFTGAFAQADIDAGTNIALISDGGVLTDITAELEAGGGHAYTSAGTAAGNGFLVLWDDNTSSYLSLIQSTAGSDGDGTAGTFAGNDLTATTLVTFTGLANAASLDANEFLDFVA